MEHGNMIYSPDNHIPMLLVYRDDNGIIHLVAKRAKKTARDDKEDMTLDEFLGLIYTAVA